MEMLQAYGLKSNTDVHTKTAIHGTWTDWLTIFLLIANTANPFFYLSVEMVGISFCILGVIFILRKKPPVSLNYLFGIFVISITTLQILQSFSYEIFPVKTFFGEYLRISFAVLCLLLLGERFTDMFLKFVTFFAIISLIFYFPSILIPGFSSRLVDLFGKYTMAPFVNNIDTFYETKSNLIFFNFNQIELFRNSGFYWEPGTHGGFLLIAIFLNLFYKKINILSNANLILILTVLTTLSTTSYIGLLFLSIIYNKDLLFKRPVLAVLIIAALIIISFGLYDKMGFLGDKIRTQVAFAEKGVAGQSRFRSLFIDLRATAEHPLIGTGRNIEMRFGSRYYGISAKNTHRNNGLGVLLSTYGVPFFILYFIFMYMSFKKMLQNSTNALFGALLLLLIGFSEDYFFKVFFFSLLLYCGISPRSEISAKPPFKKMILGPQPL